MRWLFLDAVPNMGNRSPAHPLERIWEWLAASEQQHSRAGTDGLGQWAQGHSEALMARDRGGLRRRPRPRLRGTWIAELDGRRLGCVFCVAANQTTHDRAEVPLGRGSIDCEGMAGT